MVRAATCLLTVSKHMLRPLRDHACQYKSFGRTARRQSFFNCFVSLLLGPSQGTRTFPGPTSLKINSELETRFRKERIKVQASFRNMSPCSAFHLNQHVHSCHRSFHRTLEIIDLNINACVSEAPHSQHAAVRQIVCTPRAHRR